MQKAIFKIHTIHQQTMMDDAIVVNHFFIPYEEHGMAYKVFLSTII
jgi:hypothetical protein